MRGLKALEHPDFPEFLLSGTQDESRSVRRYSAHALKGSNNPAALKALIDLLGDEHFSVRFAAFEGLQKEKDRAQHYLIESISKKKGLPLYAVDLMEDLQKKWDENEN
jgi:HEAT repeat protein